MVHSTLLTFLATALLLPSVLARGGGRGGGGGGGSGGGGGGGEGTQMIPYTEQECYTQYLSPVSISGNETGGYSYNGSKIGDKWYWIWDDNHIRDSTNLITTLQPAVSWNMEILDAYYNGTFYLTITPPSNASSTCPELKSPVIPNMFFRVGPQSRNNITRAAYGDTNPFYFQFGRTLADYACPFTANKAFVHFESSNDELQDSQAWTLTSKKNGDEFDLDGSITSTVANYGNYWNYVVNTTGPEISYPLTCPQTFSLKTLRASTGAKMNASVTPTTADLSFSFHDTEQPGYTITGSFSGTHWDKGAKIIFSGDSIQTEGEATHVKPPSPPKGKGFFGAYGKWIIIAAVVVGVILVAYIIWRCFLCCRARRNKKAAEQSQQQQGASYINTTFKSPM